VTLPTKNGRRFYSGDEIAAALGMAPPSTRCTMCGHARSDHKRVIDNPERAAREGNFPGRQDTYEECEQYDGRRTRTNGMCPCPAFSEPEK
jgi:hypothetical protein